MASREKTKGQNMKFEQKDQQKKSKIIIRKCHMCGHIMGQEKEPQKCEQCKKSFLPFNYFSKIHSKSNSDYEKLYSYGHEIHEEEMVKGLTVIW